MNKQQQIFEPLPKLKLDKKRHRVEYCPCDKSNKDGKFVPYVGFENKGYCHSCGKTFLPELPKVKQWNKVAWKHCNESKVQRPRKIDFVPRALFEKQLNNGTHLYAQNHFIQWLGSMQRGEFAFDSNTINHLIETYFLGNSSKNTGWILFPYIDIEGNIRDIKAMDYNPSSGKRIAIKNGDSQDRCYFVGKKFINNPEANTDRCFYGEHLLKGNCKPARIFESEATASYAAPFYPQSVCLGTGGKNGCKWTDKSKCRVLLGRTVILYPDIDAHQIWEQKANTLRSYGIKVLVSKLIQNNALTFAKQNGIQYEELVKMKYDLRDILQYKRLSDFLKPGAIDQSHITQPSISIDALSVKQHDNDDHYLQNRSINAYINESGELYIETPGGTTYTVYPSIEHYNNRLCIPNFINKNGISIDQFKIVQIDLVILKIM